MRSSQQEQWERSPEAGAHHDELEAEQAWGEFLDQQAQEELDAMHDDPLYIAWLDARAEEVMLEARHSRWWVA